MQKAVFYAPPPDIAGDTIRLSGEESRHLTRVLRMRIGEDIAVVDGMGNWYDATIRSADKDGVTCTVSGVRRGVGESGTQVVLGVALLKNPAKLDFAVEKAVELGVRRIVPLKTERTIPVHAKTERLGQLALAAMKQSGRSVLPDVGPLTPFADFCRQADRNALRLLPHEETSEPMIHDALRGHGHATVVLAIGPEGGFSKEEVACAVAEGFLPVSLGPRRLRAETAAMMAAGFAAVVL